MWGAGKARSWINGKAGVMTYRAYFGPLCMGVGKTIEEAIAVAIESAEFEHMFSENFTVLRFVLMLDVKEMEDGK